MTFRWLTLHSRRIFRRSISLAGQNCMKTTIHGSALGMRAVVSGNHIRLQSAADFSADTLAELREKGASRLGSKIQQHV